MNSYFLLAAALISTLVSAAEPVALFNGKDLTGWTSDVPEADKNPAIAPSFIVRNGLLVSLGIPKGHLVTEKTFSNYKLVVEYRFPGASGNCGVLVLDGIPEHLDDVMLPWEQAQNKLMMSCVSRCKGETLTLDM